MTARQTTTITVPTTYLDTHETLAFPILDRKARERDPLAALVAARDLQLILDRARESAVLEAQRAGWTWGNIGECLGVSRQSVHQQYASIVAAMAPDTRWPESPTGAP
jgi:DNA-binding NarL/FixJ family response regulator